MVEEQVELVGKAVTVFHSLISKYHNLTDKKKKKLISEISEYEKQDDVLYTKMVQALKSTFITPMDREDIHRLVMTFDSIIDTLELMTLKFPVFQIRKIDKYFSRQTDILLKEYEVIRKIIFSIKNESQVEKYCLSIRGLEKEADKVYLQALKDLFADPVKPVEIIKKQDLYNCMEEMIDEINDAALIIESLSVKYS